MTMPDGAFGERVRARLRDERVIWLTTVAADGTPQPNPVWFLWDGADAVLVYNRPDAVRLGHASARPQVSLHFDGDGRGGDIVVLAGTAAADPRAVPPHENAEYVAKYGEAMIRVSGSHAGFSEQYPVPLRIGIRRIRGH